MMNTSKNLEDNLIRFPVVEVYYQTKYRFWNATPQKKYSKLKIPIMRNPWA